jgi:hypothetical protein
MLEWITDERPSHLGEPFICFTVFEKPKREEKKAMTDKTSSGLMRMLGQKTVGLMRIPWRWRWDLNPRWSFLHTRFRGVLLRPLGHATTGEDTSEAIRSGN